MTSLSRRFFTWKFHFYEVLLPMLRCLGPARFDSVVRTVGAASTFIRPGRRGRLKSAVSAAEAALDLDRAAEGRSRFDWTGLAANAARFTARDYALDVSDDDDVLSRFDVEGYDEFREELARGDGAILVGSHLARHIAGMHWLFRNNLPIRALVQRPKHVSNYLERQFDATDEPYPQRDFFLRKDLSASAAVERIMQARSALRGGMMIYLNGDIVWEGFEHPDLPTAGPRSPVPGHLERTRRPDAEPGLLRLLHPSAWGAVRPGVQELRPDPIRRPGPRARGVPERA